VAAKRPASPRTRPPGAPSRTGTLEVWLDAIGWGPARQVGVLSHDRGQVRFRYEREWLTRRASFALDPDLSLDEHVFYPNPRAGNFGIFLDSSPDRWGQTLMDRREAMLAADEHRSPRTLHAWDYLLGVQDLTRQGALRFRFEGTSEFLDNQPCAAPPVTSLAELEGVARELTGRTVGRLDRLRRWLAVLVAPGASLGGARPKANIIQRDGSLWIAKFPSRDDDRDVAAWEMVAHTLAARAGIVVPDAALVRPGTGYHTYCTKRFDRHAAERAFFASAMTVLRRDASDDASYLDMADWLASHGDSAGVAEDLEQLYRRVAFNVAVGNRDDHLRNHGFLLSPRGWRLAPAYDVNPSGDHAEHVLAIDETDRRPSLATVGATAELYRLSPTRGRAIVHEVRAVVRGWRAVARRLRLSAAEVQQAAGAFAASE
jgi:serine/threonine-protein kinase HipA